MARTSRTAAGRNTRPGPILAAAAAGEPSSTGATTTAATAAAAAAATTTTTMKQPKTVLDKIIWAIRKQPGAATSKGVSRLSIAKFLKNEIFYDNASAIKTALKKGVDKGVLEQTGQSFRVKGDPILKHKDDGPKLVVLDLVEGGTDNPKETASSAAVAQVGDAVTVSYVGTLDDGHQFDAASSFPFVLGAGEVIKGWDQGVQGMKVGGQRKLVIPPKLGYGKRGSAPDIPGNATLHFVVTLKSISRPKEE